MRITIKLVSNLDSWPFFCNFHAKNRYFMSILNPSARKNGWELAITESQNMIRSLKIKNAEMGTLSLNFYNVIAMKPFVIRQSQISENNNRFAKLREMESPDWSTSWKTRERIFLRSMRVGLRDKLFCMVISNFCTYITMEVDEVWHPEILKNDKRVEKNDLAGLLSMLKI